MDDLDARIDALYAGPGGEFTARRAALVKDLRAAGDRDGADRVGALRRPTKLAARLNRLAREEPDALAAAIDAEEALASAQQAMLAGRSSGDDLRAATEAEAAAVAALADDPQVRAAIRAAARRPDEREQLRRGRLSHDPEPDPGAGLLLGEPSPAPAPAPRRRGPAPPAAATPASPEVDELAARRQGRALADARRLATTAADEERRAGERLAAARRDRERAEGARDAAEAEAARLRDELAVAERAAAARREEAAEAAESESRASEEAEEAGRLAAEARRLLAHLEGEATPG
jgi:hypothetical protein